MKLLGWKRESLLEELKERSGVGFPPNHPTLSHYLKRSKPEATCTAEILRQLPCWLGRGEGGMN